MKKLVLSCVGALSLVACGAPSGLEGKIAGHEFHGKDAILINEIDEGESFTYLVLTDFENACESFKANRLPKSSKLLAIVLTHVRDDGAQLPVNTGEYSLGAGSGSGWSGKRAGAQFSRLDENCRSTLPYNQMVAQSGLVKVETFDVGEGTSGTFDATFGDQKDKVSGWFNATRCDTGPDVLVEPSCE
ncbi:MAG: hypothetical protein WBV82_00210 [Myxococcaceae bacterium]